MRGSFERARPYGRRPRTLWAVLAIAMTVSSIVAVGSVRGALRADAYSAAGAVAAGPDFSCAISGSAQVWCWGAAHDGVLGNGGTTGTQASPQPATLVNNGPAGVDDGSLRYRAVAAGWTHVCAISVLDELSCWGDNSRGQLGVQGPDASAIPVVPIGMEFGVQSVTAGRGFTCAVKTSGVTFCWGTNEDGQLGNLSPGTEPVTTPTAVVGLPGNALQVAAGRAHACAVLETGRLYCWGANGFLQLGVSASPSDANPRAFADLVPWSTDAPVISVAAGDEHTCAGLADGTARCWGNAAQGRLGNGSTSDQAVLAPQVVETDGGPLSAVQSVTVGGSTSCAQTTAAVYCWGASARGQSGSGLLGNVPLATEVAELAGTPSMLATGANHSCLTLADGNVQCWGRGDQGATGLGDLNDATTASLVGPVARFRPTSSTIAFAPRIVGTASDPFYVAVENTSFGRFEADLEVDLPDAFGNFSITFDTCNGPATVLPGSTCHAYVALHPAAVGPVNATLRFTDAAAIAADIALSSAGTPDVDPVINDINASARWVQPGGIATLTADATGSDPANLTYEWRDGDSNVLASGPTLHLLAPAASDLYTLIVTDSGHRSVAVDVPIPVMVFTGNTAAYTVLGDPQAPPTLGQYNGLIWEPLARDTNQTVSATFQPVIGGACAASACPAQGVTLRGQAGTGPTAPTTLGAWLQVTWVSSTNQILVRSVFRNGLLYRTLATQTLPPGFTAAVTSLTVDAEGPTLTIFVDGACETCHHSFTATVPAPLRSLGEPDLRSVGGVAGFWGKNTTPGGLEITSFRSASISTQ